MLPITHVSIEVTLPHMSWISPVTCITIAVTLPQMHPRVTCNMWVTDLRAGESGNWGQKQLCHLILVVPLCLVHYGLCALGI